ncbi:MAG: glycosyltransferase family 39 protein [Patescibacteria group bacterium]|nr:glycosyltransferase family 39 protein [Patescibacteria group bacterium]
MKNYFKNNSDIIILLFILILAFLSRLYFFSQEGFVTTDGVQYLLSGKNLVETGKYEIFGSPQLIFPPGYSLAVGIADIFFNNLVFSARLVSFVAGFLSVYLFYLVGKELNNKKTGILASFFATTLYLFILISQETWSEALHLFFILTTVYLYLKLIKNYKVSLAIAILLGLSIGITYLIRPEGVIFLLLAGTFLFQRSRNLKLKKALSGSLAIVFTFFIIVAPYLHFLYQNTGKLCLTTKAKPNLITGVILDGKDMGKMSKNDVNFYEKTFSNYDEETNSIKLSEEFANISTKGNLFDNPNEFSRRYLKGFWSEIEILVSQYLLNIFLVPIFLLFIFSIKTKKLFKEISILSLFPIIFLALFPAFHLESRYLLQVMIFIILLSALGLSVKSKAIPDIKGFKFSSASFLKILKFMIIFLVSCNFIAIYINSLYSAPNYPLEHKLVGEYLKNSPDYDSERSIIMSRKPFVSFYAGSEKGSVPVPYTNPENILNFAEARNVNYIVIDKRWLGVRDNYEEMMDLDKYSEEAEVFYEDNSVKTIKVFKISY